MINLNVTKGFVVLVLLLSTGALLPLLGQESETTSPAQRNLVTQAIWFGIYGITFLLIVARWKQFVRVAMRDKFLLLLIGIALLSVLWSAAPEVTVRRSIALLGTTLFGAYLATRYDLGEQLRLLAWALGIAALLSLVFALLLPSYGVVSVDTLGYYGEEGGGGWRGVYGEKNALGAATALGAVVFLLLALGRRRYRWISWACFGFSVGVLLMSNALTALISFLIILALLPLYKALRWQYILIVPFFVLALLVSGTMAAWLLDNLESVLNALGRDPTFTGRTEIWPVVLESIWQRPWLGYGYGGFWLGWAGESAHLWLRTSALFSEPVGPEHAHNGFLDLWLNLGLLGVTAFVLSLLLAFFRAVVWTRSTKTVQGLWPLAYLTLMLLYTSADFPILKHHSILWILYVAVALSIPAKGAPVQKKAFEGSSTRRISPLTGSLSKRTSSGLPEPSSARRRV